MSSKKETFMCVKSFTFDSAHFLPNYAGECGNLHGHTWKVEIVVEGNELKENGMLIDFHDLSFYIEKLKKKFDHCLLNDILKIPTAENISKYIFEFFEEELKQRNINISSVRLWETPNNCVVYTKC